MEGFWTVQFQGVQGMGAGVLTLIGGHLFGGDSAFLYKGTYTQQGNTLTAQVQVNRYSAGMGSVMGRDQFALELTGAMQGNSVAMAGTVPGTPLRFNATLKKHGDFPATS